MNFSYFIYSSVQSKSAENIINLFCYFVILFIYSFILLFIYLFIYSFILLFIYLFIYSFINLLLLLLLLLLFFFFGGGSIVQIYITIKNFVTNSYIT